MAKGTSRAEAMSNSNIIKPVAVTVVELREFDGISQSGSYSTAHEQRRVWSARLARVSFALLVAVHMAVCVYSHTKFCV